MYFRTIPYENATVFALIDDGENVIACGSFKTKEDMDEATRMISVLMANLGLADNIATGVLPMTYKDFRKMLESISH